jgi:FAD/FMN-containing dehydrogenase
MTYEQYYRREEVCGICPTATPKPFVYLCLPASRYVEYTSQLLADPAESAYVTPRMSAWRRRHFKRPLARVPNEEIVYRFQLSRVLNRTLYERARDMGGTRLTSSAIPMTQADWIRHYGPAWEPFRAAKQRYDPKNVLTPGHYMFSG